MIIDTTQRDFWIIQFERMEGLDEQTRNQADILYKKYRQRCADGHALKRAIDETTNAVILSDEAKLYEDIMKGQEIWESLSKNSER